VAREINGSNTASGKQLESSAALDDTGTTACGNHLYCGSFTGEGNMAARRNMEPGGFFINLYPHWGWSWPDNRRILYNRASVDRFGQPWDPNRPVLEWNSFTKTWKGDVPDGDGPPDNSPFIMLPGGRGLVFSTIPDDGPLPEHYEPWESPVANPFSGVQNNPVFREHSGSYNEKGEAAEFPIVGTTFRIGEHWGSGQMTRNMPWLLEMTPHPYVEMSRELAFSKGIENGDMVTVRSARGQVSMYALVTRRLKPFNLGGQTVHEVAMPYHWGYNGLSTGDSANILTPNVGDANAGTPEFKAFLCDVVKEA
jgi:formate dehydrogenase major subunit